MYVIIGSVTLGFGVLDMILLPDTPTKAFFLTAREKVRNSLLCAHNQQHTDCLQAIAIERVRRNGTGMQTPSFKIKNAFIALKDPQVWGLAYVNFVIAFGNAAIGS